MKRFNYTGRQRVYREDISISVNQEKPESNEIYFSINLNNYNIPAGAEVVLEAYSGPRYFRFNEGAVEDFEGSKIKIGEGVSAEDLKFRVKFISPDNGKIVAFADKIRPSGPSDNHDPNQIGILPVRPEDLSSDGVLWKLEFDEEDLCLLYDARLGGKHIVRSDLFLSLVIPSAIREIYTRLIYVERAHLESDRDLEAWPGQWLFFAREIGAPECPGDLDDDSAIDEWIHTVIKRFSQSANAQSRWIEAVIHGGF